MRKSILVVVIAIIIAMAFSISASAATVNDILQALRDASVPEVYVLQAESYMVGKTVAPATADAVIVHINNAKAIAAGETKLSALTTSQKNGILAEIIAACALLDMTAQYSDKSITIRDSSGSIILLLSSADAIKQTGYDYSIILYGLGIFVLAGIAAFISKKALAKGRA